MRKLDRHRPLPPYEYRHAGDVLVRVYIDRYDKIYRAESAGKFAYLKLKWEATNR